MAKEVTPEMERAFIKQTNIVQWAITLLHVWRKTKKPVLVDEEMFEILEAELDDEG